tara:strand:- start:7340 stop:7870 length:531 start_codon:yes stop_codon:yes gene_type:complete
MSTTYGTQNNLLFTKLCKWYETTNSFSKMLNIINGNSAISLRIIDWFTTNYSKKHFIAYTINNKRFNVYNDYKLQLKAYSKKRFDPFCRWDRISIPYNDVEIMTTIGQLNFFKWAIENKIIEYIEENIKDIEHDMNNRNSSSKSNKDNSRKKREELSISASKSIIKEHVKITLSFD